jgi:hypothetical protein
MRTSFVRALILAIAIGATGCAIQQATPPPAPPTVAKAHPLPFKGRLLSGDPNELPPAVAMSLAKDSPVAFIYREELSHDDYHEPLAFTALDPVTYIGAPVGDIGVTAFASLAITDGDRVLGDYTAKVRVSKSYTIYNEPTHKEVEEAARAAVRDKIDQKLYRDAARLAQEVSAAPAESQAPDPDASANALDPHTDAAR